MNAYAEKTNKKALFALAMGGFGIGLTEFVIMGILPEISEALQVTIPEAGHFISAYALGVVVGAPLLTGMSQRWSYRKSLFFLMVWFTVFNTLSAFSTSYWMMLVFRFLSGLPHGAFFGIGAVAAGQLAREGKSAQAMAVMFSGLTIANVIGDVTGSTKPNEYVTLGAHIDSWDVGTGAVDDGIGMGPYKIACSMWREDDNLIFDFEGTDPQSESSINFYSPPPKSCPHF